MIRMKRAGATTSLLGRKTVGGTLPPLTSWAVVPWSSEIVVPFSVATETKPVADILIVLLRDAVGNIGIGEAAPFPSLTFDTIGSAQSAIAELCESLRALNPIEAYDRVVSRWEKVTSVTALAGVELALADLYCRIAGIPLGTLVGSRSAASVNCDITVPLMVPSAIHSFWSEVGPIGFRMIKMKVEGALDVDLDRVVTLGKILDATGRPYRISLDGNQGYRLEPAKRLLEKLARLGIVPTCFEQPLPEDDWTGLAQLTAATTVPICLDETVRTLGDARRAVTERAGSMINLKLMKSGLSGMLDIAAFAASERIPLMIGGMLESTIAMGASLQCAGSLPGIVQVDLDTPFFFRRHPSVESPWHPRSCDLAIGSQPGIGQALSPDILRQASWREL